MPIRRRYRRRTRLPFKARRRVTRRAYLPTRRRRLFRRRAGGTSGNNIIVARRTFEAAPETFVPVIIKLQDFAEFVNFSALYEAYKILSVKVKVIPKANTSFIGTSSADGSPTRIIDTDQEQYVSAPWHRAMNPDIATVHQILSLDKSRLYHGNSTSRRSFVPAFMTSTVIKVDDKTDVENAKLNWRPRIEFTSANSTEIPHYCGVYKFGVGCTYQITYTVKCLFINQKVATLN